MEVTKHGHCRVKKTKTRQLNKLQSHDRISIITGGRNVFMEEGDGTRLIGHISCRIKNTKSKTLCVRQNSWPDILQLRTRDVTWRKS